MIVYRAYLDTIVKYDQHIILYDFCGRVIMDLSIKHNLLLASKMTLFPSWWTDFIVLWFMQRRHALISSLFQEFNFRWIVHNTSEQRVISHRGKLFNRLFLAAVSPASQHAFSGFKVIWLYFLTAGFCLALHVVSSLLRLLKALS